MWLVTKVGAFSDHETGVFNRDSSNVLNRNGWMTYSDHETGAFNRYSRIDDGSGRENCVFNISCTSDRENCAFNMSCTSGRENCAFNIPCKHIGKCKSGHECIDSNKGYHKTTKIDDLIEQNLTPRVRGLCGATRGGGTPVARLDAKGDDYKCVDDIDDLSSARDEVNELIEFEGVHDAHTDGPIYQNSTGKAKNDGKVVLS